MLSSCIHYETPTGKMIMYDDFIHTEEKIKFWNKWHILGTSHHLLPVAEKTMSTVGLQAKTPNQTSHVC
jgi:hypothetical protein